MLSRDNQMLVVDASTSHVHHCLKPPDCKSFSRRVAVLIVRKSFTNQVQLEQ